MIKKIHQHKKYLALGLITAFIFGVGVLSPNISYAIGGFSLSAMVTGIFKIIAYIFNFIAGMFFATSAWLVKYTLVDLNMSVADPSINAVADVGWRVARDIANLGFVLVTVI